MNFKILGFLLPLGLVGLVACAQIPTKIETETIAESADSAEAANLPKQELTAPVLFDFLLGETALQRGYPEIAIKSYLRLAETTRDYRIAQRATEIALRIHHPFAAERAVAIWAALDPDSEDANQTAAALLINMGKLDEARPYLKKLLAAEGVVIGNAFLQLSKLLSHNDNKVETLKLVQQLAQPYPDLPEAHFVVSQAAWFAGQFELALNEMKRALALRPDWEMAAIYQGRILRRTSYADAAEFYQNFVNKYPKANDTRLAFIRLLMAERNLDQAREQRQFLLTNNPADVDVVLTVALLSMDLRDFDVAEESFKKALSLGYKDTSLIHFHLAQIYEETQRVDMAMESYRLVTSGGQFLPSQIRYAALLAQKGNLEDARQYLQQLPAANDQQMAHLILAEAQLLRESGATHQEVFDLLDSGLENLPDYPELLYDRALAADKIGKFELVEQDLRKLIQLRPDSAHAYNALGYSLAERGVRLPEALRLIKKAVALSPEDAYIMDSLGWVYYRMGNIKDGLNYLNLAFAARPDPEIAAHLGEVLWVQGAKENAIEIWQSALEGHPDNEVLLETMKRLMR
ncbi:MAG: tetratricopeptide repeat protein [Nitrosomonas sp.]|nr:tetratricopeptide repeat protein [Nitrosomonas sp.]MDP1950848.1 tetratricopeptide repeat protein [Nitrosomonas sp.]